MVNKKISVLIIFHNEERALSKSLDSIFSVDYPKKLIEVVCVDDGSTDRSVKVVKHYPVKLIKLKKRGISAARNIGLKHCIGDYILFLDAHLYLSNKDIMITICELFSKYKNIAGVCGKYTSLDKDDKNYIRDIRRFSIFHKKNNERLISLKNFTTWSIAIGAYKKEVFQNSKFPSGFENSSGEDIYLQIQLHNQGYDFLYTPEIKGIHDAKIDSKTLMRKMMYEINSPGNILLKSSIESTKFSIPFLNYFLSYPLFLILFSIGYIILPKIFLFPFVFMVLIEIIPVFKVFNISSYSFKDKLLTFFYLLAQESIKGFYLPIYLISKINRFSQINFFLKTAFYWEIQKIKKFLS